MVNDWIAGGVLSNRQGWEVQEAALAIESTVPDSIRPPRGGAERALICAEQHTSKRPVWPGWSSAAAGRGALTTETAAVERRCEQLAARHSSSSAWGSSCLTDAAARYGFLHALYPTPLHERVTPTQRQLFHRHIGERQSSLRGAAREIAAELAMHLRRDGVSKAIRYSALLGKMLRRSAHQEAIRHSLRD